jgi:hypothetical protein
MMSREAKGTASTKSASSIGVRYSNSEEPGPAWIGVGNAGIVRSGVVRAQYNVPVNTCLDRLFRHPPNHRRDKRRRCGKKSTPSPRPLIAFFAAVRLLFSHLASGEDST